MPLIKYLLLVFVSCILCIAQSYAVVKRVSYENTNSPKYTESKILKKKTRKYLFSKQNSTVHSESNNNKQKGNKKTVAKKPTGRTQTSLVVDMNSRKILHAKNIHQPIFPASLVKLMTIYMVFEAINDKIISWDTKLYTSKHATTIAPRKIGLKEGEVITVGQAVMSVIIVSANDAAIVLAEKISKTEDRFAHKMTEKAKELGMDHTIFKNASGWHHKDQKTTALDLCKLTIALKRDFPEYYHLFKKTSFELNGKTMHGHNNVLKTYTGAEGMKTGYTAPAGFNLITTATRNDKSLIGIVTGSTSSKERNQKMSKLLDKYFTNIKHPT